MRSASAPGTAAPAAPVGGAAGVPGLTALGAAGAGGAEAAGGPLAQATSVQARSATRVQRARTEAVIAFSSRNAQARAHPRGSLCDATQLQAASMPQLAAGPQLRLSEEQRA